MQRGYLRDRAAEGNASRTQGPEPREVATPPPAPHGPGERWEWEAVREGECGMREGLTFSAEPNARSASHERSELEEPKATGAEAVVALVVLAVAAAAVAAAASGSAYLPAAILTPLLRPPRRRGGGGATGEAQRARSATRAPT